MTMPNHIKMLSKKKLVKFGQELLPHPPYSPDLAPSRSLINSLKDRKFEHEDELKWYFQVFFDSKPEEFYASGICDLPTRWVKVMDTKGEYIFG